METETTLAIGYKIKLNGQELLNEDLLACDEITISEEINVPTMIVLSFNNVRFEEMSLFALDLEKIKLGDELEVTLDHYNSKNPFLAEVTMLEPKFSQATKLVVRSYDPLHRMRFGKKRRSFKDIKDSEIAAKIAQEAHLDAEVEDSKLKNTYLFQNNLTNWQYLKHRMEMLNYEIYFRNKKVIFRKSKEKANPLLTYSHNLDLEYFNVQLKALRKATEVEYRSWDVKNKRVITSTSKDASPDTLTEAKTSGLEFSEKAFGESPSVYYDAFATDHETAQVYAQASYDQNVQQFITGEGKCVGDSRLRTGVVIEVKNLGEKFSGAYYVTQTKHQYAPNKGYWTQFWVRKTAI